MRLIFTLTLVAFLFCSAHSLLAQNKEFPNAISAKLNFLDYGLFFNQEPHLSQGFEIGYFRNVYKYVNVGVPVKIGLSKLPTTFTKNRITFSSDLVAQVSNTGTSSKFIPYVFAGGGIASDDLAGTYLQVPIGAGLQYKVGKYALLTVQGEFRKSLEDNNRDNFQASLGFVYLLHKPDPSALDADNDGTPDALDKCPTAAGPATALGCPDADKDGIADSEDLCPDAAGPLETNGCPDADNDNYPDAVDKCPDTPGALNGCPDTDKDGFADADDECPTEPGRWDGCPDTDLDGIADKDDKCPTEAGSAENMGCPEKIVKDADNDSFADDTDLCPDVAGTLNGCPDTDGDGIADKDDKCPTEAGVAAEGGCPVKVALDSDKDGIPDADDSCPFIAGTAKGCPDTDNDGVADNDDKCPTLSGAVANNGCPEVMDADGDGFADKDDLCPFLAGSAKGCPDADKDGIADKDDKCPNEAGVASNKGCPEVMDADADGFPDDKDECPYQAGVAKGCPDADADGVADKDDPCPNQKGTLNGCPDTDGDGLADKNDPCPDKKGTVNGCPDTDSDGIADKDDPCPDKPGAYNGCPDTDKDGTPDNVDKCPTEAGPFGNSGCPEKAPVAVVIGDTDGDGVKDDKDKCPNTAGPASNNGCPEIRKETKERLAFAMQAVQFETGKASLKGPSYAILDEIVEIMRQYPDYKLSISGHTDNVGDDDTNLRLSTERAKACQDYFIFRGISAARLRFAGFGEARPLADNDSASGREVNRRVEFELTLD
jgi:outer membrane protein OmpA-like peptidoglycan-associated protein